MVVIHIHACYKATSKSSLIIVKLHTYTGQVIVLLCVATCTVVSCMRWLGTITQMDMSLLFVCPGNVGFVEACIKPISNVRLYTPIATVQTECY